MLKPFLIVKKLKMLCPYPFIRMCLRRGQVQILAFKVSVKQGDGLKNKKIGVIGRLYLLQEVLDKRAN